MPACAWADLCGCHTNVQVGTAGTYRLWAIVDSGTGGVGTATARDSYLAYSAGRGINVWLLGGDNAYTDATQAQYDANLFWPYADVVPTTVMWPTMGNHEQNTASSAGVCTVTCRSVVDCDVFLERCCIHNGFGWLGFARGGAAQSGPYYSVFSMPQRGEVGGYPSGTKAYYSFNYGSVHVIALNSCDEDRSDAR